MWGCDFEEQYTETTTQSWYGNCFATTESEEKHDSQGQSYAALSWCWTFPVTAEEHVAQSQLKPIAFFPKFLLLAVCLLYFTWAWSV